MNRKALFSSFIGNTLEFYDFALYGALAGLFTKLFFPNGDVSTSILFSGTGVFAIGLIARPLGGVVFGYIGDRYSRRTALSLSMYLMAVPSFMLIVLPTYEMIGLLAPALLISARILQGFCTGGEYNGAAIFALEHQKNQHKGLVSGLMTASSASGLLLATLVSLIFTHTSLPEWSWRIPFFFGMCIALFGYYIRRKNLESPEFQASLKAQKFTNAPIIDALQNYKFPMLVSALIAGQTAVLAYMMFTLIAPNSILSPLNLLYTKDQLYVLSIIGLITFAVSCVFSGVIAQKLPHKTYVMLASAVLATLFIIPIFNLILSGVFIYAVLGQLLFGFLSGLQAGPQHIYMQEIFPNNLRYSAISFSFSLGTGLLGGLTPLVSKYIINAFNTPPFLWVMFSSVLLCSCLLYAYQKQSTFSLKHKESM